MHAAGLVSTLERSRKENVEGDCPAIFWRFKLLWQHAYTHFNREPKQTEAGRWGNERERGTLGENREWELTADFLRRANIFRCFYVLDTLQSLSHQQ